MTDKLWVLISGWLTELPLFEIEEFRFEGQTFSQRRASHIHDGGIG